MDDRRHPDHDRPSGAAGTGPGAAGGHASDETRHEPSGGSEHDRTRHDRTREDHLRDEHPRREPSEDGGHHASGPVGEREREERRHEAFGGANVGAAFFGWLVAVALAILLVSILGAVAAALGETLDVSRADAEGEVRTLGLGAAIALLVVLMIGYFAGGYVAGRMSRYDGGRQGLAVWVIGLVVTVAAAVVGFVFGRQYDVLGRFDPDLPSIPVPDDTVTVGGLVTLAAVVVGTLLAAMVGGKVGHRYHRKVDRFAG